MGLEPGHSLAGSSCSGFLTRLQSSWDSLGKNLLPRSLTWLLGWFISLCAIDQKVPLLSCHMDLSLGRLQHSGLLHQNEHERERERGWKFFCCNLIFRSDGPSFLPCFIHWKQLTMSSPYLRGGDYTKMLIPGDKDHWGHPRSFLENTANHFTR